MADDKSSSSSRSQVFGSIGVVALAAVIMLTQVRKRAARIAATVPHSIDKQIPHVHRLVSLLRSRISYHRAV